MQRGPRCVYRQGWSSGKDTHQRTQDRLVMRATQDQSCPRILSPVCFSLSLIPGRVIAARPPLSHWPSQTSVPGQGARLGSHRRSLDIRGSSRAGRQPYHTSVTLLKEGTIYIFYRNQFAQGSQNKSQAPLNELRVFERMASHCCSLHTGFRVCDSLQ